MADGASARVETVEVQERSLLLEGRAFGAAGPYERLRGRVHFSVDPHSPADRRIVDIALAPRQADGRVHASAEFMILRPVRGCRERCLALLEVPNRGRASMLFNLDFGRFTQRPDSAEDLGEAWLLEQGLVLAWVGWQFDVPRGQELFGLEAPVAGGQGGALEGLARSDWTVERRSYALPLGHRGQRPYPVADPRDPRNRLTERDSPLGPARELPREDWDFARVEDGRPVADPGWVFHRFGFQPGRLYELVYAVRDPAVVGLGLAAVRDFALWLKQPDNALAGASHVLAFGLSQSGRFLRHALYQGFVQEGPDRLALDGLLVHAAGAGRGSFNHRYAQPSRDAHAYSSFFFPTDLFPFTGARETDPESGLADALYPEHPGPRPRVIFTNTGYEYWGRAASLTHTDVEGLRDLASLAHERHYHLAGAQHFVTPGARLAGYGEGPGENPLDVRFSLRAALAALIDWVVEGRPAPPSLVPRLETGTLVPFEAWRAPAVPGLVAPRGPYVPRRLDFGPRWAEGIVDREPPGLGAPYAVRVPALDADGNELGGLRGIELRVPLGTFTPWRPLPWNGELDTAVGQFVPFAPSREQRAQGDARAPLAERYAGQGEYLERVREALGALQAEGWLLERDRERAEAHALALWRALQPAPAGTPPAAF